MFGHPEPSSESLRRRAFFGVKTRSRLQDGVVGVECSENVKCEVGHVVTHLVIHLLRSIEESLSIVNPSILALQGEE